MNRYSLFLILLIIAFFTGCKDKSDDIAGFDEYPTIDRLIDEGYTQLQNGEYEEANLSFREANERDAFDSRVYDGLGWSYFYLRNTSVALVAFNNLTEFGTSATDTANAAMGKALINEIIGDLNASKAMVKQVLEIDANYVHPFMDFINVNDINLLMAKMYYDELKYDSSLVELRKNNASALNSTAISELDTISSGTQVDIVTGIVRIPIKGNPVLITDILYESQTGYTEFIQLDFNEKEVVFIANPIANIDDSFTITYESTDSYGTFLDELNAEIVSQGELYSQ